MLVPTEVRRELERHALEEAPNEACGLVVLRDGRAVGYERGRNADASPYRFRLEVEPEVWFLEDEGYELAVFHSHPETEPRPSRTDRELSGLWAGRTFLIYGLVHDDLRAWRIAEDMPEGSTVVAILADGGWKYLSAGFWRKPDEDVEESMETTLWW